eukprot:15483403-Alexandrium_andersonii.AAC.1
MRQSFAQGRYVMVSRQPIGLDPAGCAEVGFNAASFELKDGALLSNFLGATGYMRAVHLTRRLTSFGLQWFAPARLGERTDLSPNGLPPPD